MGADHRWRVRAGTTHRLRSSRAWKVSSRWPPQTLRRVATSLHSLLATLNVVPPYVLVGHSYGGVVIRAFAQQFSTEVTGLVYIDVPDVELTYAEADQLGPSGRQVAFSAPPVSSSVPAGLRAELDNIVLNLRTEFAEARAARPPSSIPCSVVIIRGALGLARRQR